jgi:putative ABC transport system substrate-binding protein
VELLLFLQGLKETGYVEGQNVAIEYRWAENQIDRLPALAAELVRGRVAVIITSGSAAALSGHEELAPQPCIRWVAVPKRAHWPIKYWVMQGHRHAKRA